MRTKLSKTDRSCPAFICQPVAQTGHVLCACTAAPHAFRERLSPNRRRLPPAPDMHAQPPPPRLSFQIVFDRSCMTAAGPRLGGSAHPWSRQGCGRPRLRHRRMAAGPRNGSAFEEDWAAACRLIKKKKCFSTKLHRVIKHSGWTQPRTGLEDTLTPTHTQTHPQNTPTHTHPPTPTHTHIHNTHRHTHTQREITIERERERLINYRRGRRICCSTSYLAVDHMTQSRNPALLFPGKSFQPTLRRSSRFWLHMVV